ncbi:Glycyl-tRNA synthetase, partial [hydrothermal vent metagenome]
MTDNAHKSMDDIVALCKRRGFVYPASEIYGGINGFWDYGPLGTQLKNNLRDAWWEAMVLNPPKGPDGERLQIVGLDSSIIQNPKVWEASGHVGGFNDPMQTCHQCKKLLRADHVLMMVQDSKWFTSLLDQLCSLASTSDWVEGAIRWSKKEG